MYGYNVNIFISSNNFGLNKVSSIMRLNEIRIWYSFVSEKMSQMLRMERNELCMLMHKPRTMQGLQITLPDIHQWHRLFLKYYF